MSPSPRWSGPIDWFERHQVALYLTSLLVGSLLGLALPAVAQPAGVAITPVLGALLYVTFLGVPVARLGRAVRDRRFLATVLVLNFVLVPLVVFALTRIMAVDQAILVGVLFVLLAPCVDYVLVFARLAGGDSERLLAATPVMMLVQLVLLPGYLWLFAGPAVAASVDLTPFAQAFGWLIALPLALAWLTQWAANRWSAAERWMGLAQASMVPLMCLTLAVVVASQIGGVAGRVGSLLPAVGVFVVFAVVMVPLGALVGRVARLDVAARRSVVFSGTTRNSLVVLPLALALPAGYELAGLVVVTQTLIELVVMVCCVRLIPQLVGRR